MVDTSLISIPQYLSVVVVAESTLSLDQEWIDQLDILGVVGLDFSLKQFSGASNDNQRYYYSNVRKG